MKIPVQLMYMSLLDAPERHFLSAVSRLAYCNPFTPDRIEHERAALGPDYLPGDPVWSLPVDDPQRPRENVWRIAARLEALCETLRERVQRRLDATESDL